MWTQDHSQRPHGNIVTQGQQVEIGGNDRYMAVCRKCWTNKKIEKARRNMLPFETGEV